jgi:hypothetical protein
VLATAGRLPGVDVELSATAAGLKEALTLAGPRSASDFGYVVSLSDGLVPRLDARTGAIVVERSGHAVFDIPRPTVTDAHHFSGPVPRYVLGALGEAGWV